MKKDFKQELYIYITTAKEVTLPSIAEGFDVTERNAEKVAFELVKEGVFDYTLGVVYAYVGKSKTKTKIDAFLRGYCKAAQKTTLGAIQAELEMSEKEALAFVNTLVQDGVLEKRMEFLFKFTGRPPAEKPAKEEKRYSFLDDDEDTKITVGAKKSYMARMHNGAAFVPSEIFEEENDEDDEDDEEEEKIRNAYLERRLQAAHRHGKQRSTRELFRDLIHNRRPNIADDEDEEDETDEIEDDDGEYEIDPLIELTIEEYEIYQRLRGYARTIGKDFSFNKDSLSAIWDSGISYPDDTQMRFELFVEDNAVWLGDMGGTTAYLRSRHMIQYERLQKRMQYVLDDYAIKIREDEQDFCIRLRDENGAFMSFMWLFSAMERCISIHSEGDASESVETDARYKAVLKKIVSEEGKTFDEAKTHARVLLAAAIECGDEAERRAYEKVVATFETITEAEYENFKRVLRGEDD